MIENILNESLKQNMLNNLFNTIKTTEYVSVKIPNGKSTWDLDKQNNPKKKNKQLNMDSFTKENP